MFYRIVDKEVTVRLSVPQFTEGLFRLTDQNRSYLKSCLPWLDRVREPADTRAFITLQLERFSRGEALHETLFYKGEMAGVLGFNLMDRDNGIGHIGYWLGEEFTGRGIMTRAVRDLVALGFEYFDLRRMDIRCAVDNARGRGIPERLGFENEGIIRGAEKVYDTYNDHVIYGLIRSCPTPG